MRHRTTLLAISCALFVAACQSGPHGAEADASQRIGTAHPAPAEVSADAAASPVALPAPPPAPQTQALMRAKVANQQAYAASADLSTVTVSGTVMAPQNAPAPNTEKYDRPEDNPVKRVADAPLSTFSIDVDTGSYSNVRRILNAGGRPPADAVRAEEFINYFRYGHAAPTDRAQPFRVSTELAPSPWDAHRKLVMVGIKGYDVPQTRMAPMNLVFLVDTSGSMDEPDKLPLVKAALNKLVPQLRAEDRISIVVYAGSAGLVLPPTAGNRHDEILGALDRLQAGGSTNGGEGIQLAYRMAKQAFQPNGVNRVILATDGDFNVGIYDRKALETLVSDQRKSGIALTTLGFGQGNYNDAMAERLADVGNGNHAYIDSEREAEKVLVREMRSTMVTIASDVKIQVEFNPAQVAEYRLIGYENRALRDEDFDNDAVDAGEIGAGHEVTALYEIALMGEGGERLPKLRYARPEARAAHGNELALLKLRYKLPGGEKSRLIEQPILRTQLRESPSEAMRFATAVAAYADALRGGKNIGGWDFARIRQWAGAALGRDAEGDRREFLGLVDRAARALRGNGSDPAIAE